MTENNAEQKKEKCESIKNNSEILFIYDAKMCNPNGDPDDENKPRMDYDRNINLVSDLRLKRYIRDYLMDYKDKTVFVCKEERASVNAKTRLASILGVENTPKINITEEQVNKFLDVAIDVKMFGGIIPDVKFKEGKANVTFTGPIQFNWGYSLNKVTGPMDSSGITSHFHTGKQSEEEESTKGTGAMGKDYRLPYSLIAFHGIISAKRAEHTCLINKDIKLFDEAMIKAIPLEATTRSKKGQNPLLYLRIEYVDNEFFFCDLRKYVELSDLKGNEIDFDKAKLSSTKDYKLNLEKLKEKLESHKDKIKDIHFWKHQDLETAGFDDLKNGTKWEVKYKENGEEKTREIKFIELLKPKEEKQKDVQ